jgi:hypothetical protein
VPRIVAWWTMGLAVQGNADSVRSRNEMGWWSSSSESGGTVVL